MVSSLNIGLRIGANGSAGGGGGGGGLPAGFVHRYDFSSNDNLTLSGSEITSAADIGSTGTNIGSIATRYPLNSGAINGVQAADFDGSNDILKFTTGINSGFSTANCTMTLSLVFQMDNTSSDQVLLGMSTNGATDPFIMIRLLSSQYGVWMFDESANSAFPQFGTVDTSPHVLTLTVGAGDLCNIWLDGTKTVTDFDVSNANTRIYNGALFLGAAVFSLSTENRNANCRIGEALFYASELSSSDISDLNTFLLSKWGFS